MKFEKDTIVTISTGSNASNTFMVDTDEGDTVLLTHPLAPSILIRTKKDLINTVSANVKDSSERCVDYANANKSYLDYNSAQDLDSVGLFFAVRRKLTPRQKQVLANICGNIASVKFNGDLREAMDFISKNSSLLDEFNLMWFNNFNALFTGRQPVTSKKQRGAIFNIAGYVLAELETPTIQTSK